MATGTPADEGDIRIEEDDILDNGSDMLTSTDHMSEDPVSMKYRRFVFDSNRLASVSSFVLPELTSFYILVNNQ